MSYSIKKALLGVYFIDNCVMLAVMYNLGMPIDHILTVIVYSIVTLIVCVDIYKIGMKRRG